MFYPGTTKEIRVGDVIALRGECDGRNLNGRKGRVLMIHPESYTRGYVLFVEIDCPRYGKYQWHIRRENIALGDSGADVCWECDAKLDPRSKLGARLFTDAHLCDACIADKINRVNSYHFGKSLSYKYAKDKITLGVEIEIDGEGERDSVIADVIKCARKNNYALIMSHENDGSLDYDGFESVTAPLTLAEWKTEEVQAQLDALFTSAEENGFNFYTDDHAGLHVHIGRKDLCGDDRRVSDAVGLLMGWAVDRLWERGFERLSRREDLEYCHLFSDGDRGETGLYDTDAVSDRYFAVNIQNTKTIELRVFKGARNLRDVLVAVDVCYMLAKWATKKINAYLKRTSYSVKAKQYTDAKMYADNITWNALAKYSKFPEITLPALRSAGVEL